MRKLTCILVDDQETAIQKLKGLCELIERLVVQATFTNPKDALAYLRYNHVDFVILDIQMEPINGIACMAQISETIKVVLCSAFTEFAYEGYQKNAIDFVDKDVDLERLNIALTKVEFALGLNDSPLAAGAGEYYYFIKGMDGKTHRVRIEFDDIVYFETANDLTNIYLQDSTRAQQTRQRLKEITQVLPPEKFKRVHKSFVINQDYLKEYKDKEITMKPYGTVLPVGRSDVNRDFFDWIKKYTAK